MPKINFRPVPRLLFVINLLIAIVYASWWLNPDHRGYPLLYSLLFVGEIYHLVMAFTFWFTMLPQKKFVTPPDNLQYRPTVDIYIPVAGEPENIIRKTSLAAKYLDYPNHQVYILNDGFVAGKSNWREVETLADNLGVHCITRRQPGGAKAGNLNHALKMTQGELIVIFDADMVPAANFLNLTIPYFQDNLIGFVQTPQYYDNHHINAVASGAWDQQKLFFGPILWGKDRSNATFICGTNVVIRRQALEAVGGMMEDNIAEDFLTSLNIHQQGWKSRYIPKVLVKGLAPEDLGSYYKQQFRWARGSLEVLFSQNPIFKSGLTFAQKVQYLSSALYYLNGLIILIDMMMPIIFLFTGLQPVSASTTSFAVFFLPFMFINLYTLNYAANADLSFNTFAFSYSLWFLQLQALASLVLGQKTSFSVTPKQAQAGSYFSLALPHLLYIVAGIIGVFIALGREDLNPSVATNTAWVIFNVVLFLPFILIALKIRPAATKS